MKVLSKQVKDDQVDWNLLNSTGEFLAELYVVDGLKIIVFNNWLEQAKSLAIENDIALKILLDVFKIFQCPMKKRDENAYKNLIGFLKDFKIIDRIPEDYVEWFDKLLSEKGVDVQVVKIEKSKAVGSTGAVKKV